MRQYKDNHCEDALHFLDFAIFDFAVSNFSWKIELQRFFKYDTFWKFISIHERSRMFMKDDNILSALHFTYSAHSTLFVYFILQVRLLLFIPVVAMDRENHRIR